MNQGRRTIKSYVLRQGRLTRGQQQALDMLWSDYGINYTAEALNLDQCFEQQAPVTLEIGFGNGESLLQQAEHHPENNYLGIEVHRPGVGHLIKRAHDAGLHNIRVINHDAVEVLQHQIADNSLDCVQLFFPDPWHKKRHHKRRIVHPAFVQMICTKLKTGGLFHLATDWENYAEHMMAVMEQAQGFDNTSGKGNYAGDTDRPPTKFEHRGRKLGHGVWDLVYKKTGNQPDSA
jgi:tRNA (guanine-N7-)-methyltransferase